jgi:hypothetical protein
MSSTLRLSIITVLLLASTALGFIAYNMMQPKAAPIAPIAVQATPKPSNPEYLVAKYTLKENTLMRDHYLRTVALADAPPGALTPSDVSKLSGALVRKNIDIGNVITSQNLILRDDPDFFAALGQLCEEANSRQKATVTIYAYYGSKKDDEPKPAKATEYSVKKINAKASEACLELDATYPTNKVVAR